MPVEGGRGRGERIEAEVEREGEKGGTPRLKSECCEAKDKRVTRNAVKVKLQRNCRRKKKERERRGSERGTDKVRKKDRS